MVCLGFENVIQCIANTPKTLIQENFKRMLPIVDFERFGGISFKTGKVSLVLEVDNIFCFVHMTQD